MHHGTSCSARKVACASVFVALVSAFGMGCGKTGASQGSAAGATEEDRERAGAQDRKHDRTVRQSDSP